MKKVISEIYLIIGKRMSSRFASLHRAAKLLNRSRLGQVTMGWKVTLFFEISSGLFRAQKRHFLTKHLTASTVAANLYRLLPTFLLTGEVERAHETDFACVLKLLISCNS